MGTNTSHLTDHDFNFTHWTGIAGKPIMSCVPKNQVLWMREDGVHVDVRHHDGELVSSFSIHNVPLNNNGYPFSVKYTSRSIDYYTTLVYGDKYYYGIVLGVVIKYEVTDEVLCELGPINVLPEQALSLEYFENVLTVRYKDEIVRYDVTNRCVLCRIATKSRLIGLNHKYLFLLDARDDHTLEVSYYDLEAEGITKRYTIMDYDYCRSMYMCYDDILIHWHQAREDDVDILVHDMWNNSTKKGHRTRRHKGFSVDMHNICYLYS